ncbi:response regulator [Halovivax sp.]|uniref:response regulator n=1 Tax=Halovivax sp. TaxID=1935978 RepID=UPI0025B9C6EB|nr:response regulator [Halovivax sp.]
MSYNFSESDRLYDVLLVEPNPDRVSRFIESFESTPTTNEVAVVSDGEEAFEFIDQRGEHADAPRPDLVLLDLHLSDDDGPELLAELKESAELRQIPVLVLTPSDASEDIVRSYELHANAYLRKPDSSAEFDRLARAIEEFWLKLVRLPPKER